MQVIHERCAGLDIGKSVVVACVRRPHKGGGREQEVRTFEAFLDALEALRDWLVAERVTHVAMEATGPYWAGLVRARIRRVPPGVGQRPPRHAVPGRKTDVKDACGWPSCASAGLLAGSFVPPPVIRELRDLTRYRKRLIQDRTREAQRVDKVLQDAAIKLGSVASETLGVSSRAVAGDDRGADRW